jgi:hypothetical protein
MIFLRNLAGRQTEMRFGVVDRERRKRVRRGERHTDKR